MVSERDGSHTEEVVLCWGLVEQARHEHMSDEFKNSILLMYLRNPHPGYQRNETPQWFHYRTGQKGVVKRTNTGLPNTYHITKLWKLSQHPIGHNSLIIYPPFGIKPFHFGTAHYAKGAAGLWPRR